MKLKDFKIIDVFRGLSLFDKNDNKIAYIFNYYSSEKFLKNSRDALFDGRTQLEKWNEYKNCEILEIRNAKRTFKDNKVESELNYVEIKLDLESEEE